MLYGVNQYSRLKVTCGIAPLFFSTISHPTSFFPFACWKVKSKTRLTTVNEVSPAHEAHLEIDGVNGKDDAGKDPLVCHKAVEASDILSRVSSFVHQSVEWRPEPAAGRAPTGEHFVTCRIRDSIPVSWVVEEIIMGPVVEGWPGNKYQIHQLLRQWLWGKSSTLGNTRKHCKVQYTGCPRRNGQNFGRVFLMLNYTDITRNTYIKSWTVTEIMAIEKCGLLGCPRTVRRPWRHTRHCA